MRLTKGAAAGATLLWFLACYFSTAPDYIADTLRFVVDAIEHAKGKQGQFWEFGHILWRRWAYVGYSLLGAWYAQWFGDSPVQAVARFLIQTNFICSAVALQLMLLILRGFVSAWIALASVFAMTCAYPFLNFCHSGAPYIPALSCAMLTLYLVIRATENPEKGGQFAFMASISFTLACGLWFTYAFSGLGMVAALWLMNTNNSGESSASLVGRRDLVLLFLGSLTFAAFLLFAAGAAAHGIRNGSRLFQWIKESDNGWQQSQNALRAITGLARSIWNTGGDTLSLKRWILHDPYNPVNLYQTWSFRLAWKVGAFYIALAAVLWVLWKERRSVLWMLGAAGIPMLLFAIMLFEPSSSERFLPLFPFLFLGYACVLGQVRRHNILAGFVAAFLSSVIVLNLVYNWTSSSHSRLVEAHRRIDALRHTVRPQSIVFLVTFWDDAYSFPPLRPLDSTLQTPFRLTDTVVAASDRTAKWREDFAKRALERWNADREVWISERHLASRPESDWAWVEGDAKGVRWPEIPAMFGTLEFDAKILPGKDGFFRLARTESNMARLVKELAPATGTH